MFARPRPLLSPHESSGGSGLEFTRDAYVALVKVLHEAPADVPQSLAIAVCANNFANNMVVALKRGFLSPEVALDYLSLGMPDSGRNVFAETKHLAPLVGHVAEHIIERIESGSAVSAEGFEDLRKFIAMPHDLGVDTSVLAYRALIAGCTRSFTVSSPLQGIFNVCPDPQAHVQLLGRDLRCAALEHPREVAALVARMGEIPVPLPLVVGVNSIFDELSRPGSATPAEVQHEAKIAKARRAE